MPNENLRTPLAPVFYVDVHTHLTHDRFQGDRDLVIQEAIDLGVKVIITNGLEPKSNDLAIELSKKFPEVKAATGIYPSDAVNHLLPEDFHYPVHRFSVADEIARIRGFAEAKLITAVGECGLDGHHLDSSTFPEQEKVFLQLLEIAYDFDLPAIIHTRKLEKRAMEILEHHKLRKINFHCFCGKSKLALQGAEKHGWFFSIPANARNSESFTKLLKELPFERILTETDAPYLAPIRGERNEPKHVVGTVKYLAELRGISTEDAARQISQNLQVLLSK